MLNYLLCFILFINFIGLLLMYIDKMKAIKNQYRISEKTLWFVSFLGGAGGLTIGMKWFRHKSQKVAFKWGLPGLTIFHFFH